MNQNELKDRLQAVVKNRQFNKVDREIAFTGVARDYFRSLHHLEGAMHRWDETMAIVIAEENLLKSLQK